MRLHLLSRAQRAPSVAFLVPAGVDMPKDITESCCDEF